MILCGCKFWLFVPEAAVGIRDTFDAAKVQHQCASVAGAAHAGLLLLLLGRELYKLQLLPADSTTQLAWVRGQGSRHHAFCFLPSPPLTHTLQPSPPTSSTAMLQWRAGRVGGQEAGG